MSSHDDAPVGRRRVALVTGAASGIGAAVARQLGEDGLAVALVDRDSAGLEQAADLVGRGHAVTTALCDVTDPGRVAEVVDGIAEWGNGLDVVVNAAGVLVRADVRATTVDVWQRVMAVNLHGAFLVIQAALPLLRDADPGSDRRIVNIGSGAATRGYAYPAYTASKGGLIALTREVAAEAAPFGITVNAVNPGVVRTPINRDAWSDESVRERWERLIPLGRLGAPEDVAALVGFLASPGAGYITGQAIAVDGGRSEITTNPW